MIEIQHLSFSYGKRPVLKDVSFSAGPGDCVAILGNNGAGKSTLITCLSKIRTPDGGSVRIDGQDVAHMSRGETARTIAYVPQKSELGQSTVFDAVLLGRKPYMKWGPTARDYELCETILDRVGLGPLKLRPVGELSGGEAQKVMLARAFVQQPKLLLLDEPTSSLDPRNQYEMMGLVGEIARAHSITVLVVLHDLNLALRCCNRFVFLRDGLVYAAGDTSVVTEQVLRDVYEIKASLITHQGKKFAVIG